MRVNANWRHGLMILAFFVFGCSESSQKTESHKGEFDAVLGIKDTMLPLEFTYKPGYVGTKFVDTGKASASGVSGQPSQRVSTLSIDKIEYIQNYIVQKQNPDFLVVEGRDLLIRIHAFANISNITAPDMRIIIDGPPGIKYSVRLPATGGLPGVPENSGQAVDYRRTSFTQAYLFKVPAEHIIPGTYKVTLEVLPKPDSGLSVSKHEDTFVVTAQSPALKIRVYEGIVGGKRAAVPSSEQIVATLRKFWPVGELSIERVPRSLMVEFPFDEKGLYTLAEEAKVVDESLYLKSKYIEILHDAVKQLSFTRTLTQSEAIEILFAPVPEGGAHYMQSILVSDKDWEVQLARQFGHALGLGIAPDCVLSTEKRVARIKASKPITMSVILDGRPISDEGEATIENMEDYRWEQRYWTLDWKDKDQIKINSPVEYADLMSSCKKTRFPHLYYYGKVLQNMLGPLPEQPLLNHPSNTVREFYKKNGLAEGLVVRAEIPMDPLRKALIQKKYKKIPTPKWSYQGELKRMLAHTSKVRSPHAIVLEGLDGKSTRVIELFLSSDKHALVGVTSMLDLPKPIKSYGLYINKVRVASGTVPKIFNKGGSVKASGGQKGDSFVMKWDARETYNTRPGLLVYNAYGQKAELAAIGLKQGIATVETGTMDPHQGTMYLLLPYSRASIFGGLDEGIDTLMFKKH